MSGNTTRPTRTEKRVFNPELASRFGGRQIIRLRPAKGLQLDSELMSELVEVGSNQIVCWPVG